ncbi:hypothetical protein [Rathayibacter tritici]|uniref:Carboxylate--amine ligase n=1 Tax=Rathayibacter tritici TaxID=33888 RepID=A0A160KW45_9MICO|nr:hypothetical protein [Rathayibacter tritici]AND17987.1 hypothetical protein A6122_2879 [Rathayibacter tritici]PPI47462.1 hypothetical protein C5D18_03620 [Rathayibacter tritici]
MHAEDSALIGVQIRALTETAVRDESVGVPPVPLPTPVIAVSSWLASRHGTTGDLIDPVESCPAPASTVLTRLLDHAGRALAEAGDEEVAARGVERVLARGTGAERQRAVWARTGAAAAVIADAAEATRA